MERQLGSTVGCKNDHLHARGIAQCSVRIDHDHGAHYSALLNLEVRCNQKKFERDFDTDVHAAGFSQPRGKNHSGFLAPNVCVPGPAPNQRVKCRRMVYYDKLEACEVKGYVMPL